MSTPTLPCGCVDSSKLGPMDGRRGGTCVDHAQPRMPTGGRLSAKAPPSLSTEWYIMNCCPFCGRASAGGFCCGGHSFPECPTCGLVVCSDLRMGHYYLERDHGLICRGTIATFKNGKGRTTGDKRKLAELIASPEKEATPEKVRALFRGSNPRR